MVTKSLQTKQRRRFREYLLDSNETGDQPQSSDNQMKFPSVLYRAFQELPSNEFGKFNVKRINEILSPYTNEGDRNKVRKKTEQRQRFISTYQPLYKDLYTLDPETFFSKPFLKAMKENTVTGLKSLVSEPSPGLYTFEMFQPHFCKRMVAEVCNIEKWLKEGKHQVVKPSTVHNYGFVLDDFGFEPMLTALVDSYINPLSKVLFPEVVPNVGSDLEPKLDSHHGFIVEYGKHRETNMSFHVDKSEVTLNVCLGDIFTDGLLYFRGVRCEKHQNGESGPEENFDYIHSQGHALLHRGHHRHYARGTTSGYRLNLILWCRSSFFQEMTRYQKDFPEWCIECSREKKRKQSEVLADVKQRLMSKFPEN